MSTPRLVINIQSIEAEQPKICCCIRVSYTDQDPDTGEGINRSHDFQESVLMDEYLKGGYQAKAISRAIAEAVVSEDFTNYSVPTLPPTIPTLVCGLTIPEPTVLSGIWPIP
jgi:hypothetical protein